MNRETLKKIDRFLTFGDIKEKVDETDCYYITDRAMQKVIDGFSKELLELHRIITMNQLIEARRRAGQVEPVVILELAETLKTNKIEKDLEEYLRDKQIYKNYGRDFRLPDDAADVARYVGIFIRTILVDIKSKLSK